MVVNKWFEFDAHRIRTVKGKKYIASIFNTAQAEKVCDMLNDLTVYKMIVRNNKQIIEDINQKSISELKKEVYGEMNDRE